MKRNISKTMAVAMLFACQSETPTEGGGKEAPSMTQASEADAPAANATASETGKRSQFTSIEPATCQLLEENREEGGWWRRLCKGPRGYDLELSESDLRQDIVVVPAKGQRDELGLSTIVANGAFNSLGKTAEWRGVDPANPDVLIVRLDVARDPEARRPDISHLVLARLKPTACIVAVVQPGPGQNDRAREIADGALPECLKR